MTTRSCKVDQTELYKVKRIIKKIKRFLNPLDWIIQKLIKDKNKKEKIVIQIVGDLLNELSF